MVRPEGHRPDWLQCPVGIYVKHGTQVCMVIQSEKLHQTIVGKLQVAPPYVCNGHELRDFHVYKTSRARGTIQRSTSS